MNEIVIALIALLATLSVVAALVAVAVYAMSRKPNRAEAPAVRPMPTKVDDGEDGRDAGGQPACKAACIPLQNAPREEDASLTV